LGSAPFIPSARRRRGCARRLPRAGAAAGPVRPRERMGAGRVQAHSPFSTPPSRGRRAARRLGGWGRRRLSRGMRCTWQCMTVCPATSPALMPMLNPPTARSCAAISVRRESASCSMARRSELNRIEAGAGLPFWDEEGVKSGHGMPVAHRHRERVLRDHPLRIIAAGSSGSSVSRTDAARGDGGLRSIQCAISPWTPALSQSSCACLAARMRFRMSSTLSARAR